VPIHAVPAVIRALRAAHPYEEPAFDLNQLAAPPEGIGQGRIGAFDQPVERSVLFDRLKQGLAIEHLLVAGPTEGTVSRAAVGAGAGGEMLSEAIAGKADLYLTGEMRHHDALRAAAAGVTAVCTLHSNSERIAFSRLKQRLEQALPGLGFLLSQADRDPFAVR
jgi:putative NIF3 family GTP cyclohydrolase 1 type 2